MRPSLLALLRVLCVAHLHAGRADAAAGQLDRNYLDVALQRFSRQRGRRRRPVPFRKTSVRPVA